MGRELPVKKREAPAREHLGLLFRLEGARLARRLRHPRPGVWASVLLPAVLVLGALRAAGAAARPDLSDPQGRAALGLVLAAVAGYQVYPILFRPADDPFLRRLGIHPLASYALRAFRLLLLVLVLAAAALVPFLPLRDALGEALRVVGAAGLFAWAAALFAVSGAARRVAASGGRPGAFGRTIPFDPQLAGSAPLVFAPLLALVAGAVAAVFVGGPGAGWRIGVLIAGSAILALAGAARFAAALPRFAPRAQEMAFAPPPEAGEAGLVLGRGLARLLPRRVAAARARDAAVAARRFRWATSLVWPVVFAAGFALARWGEQPSVRAWVLLAGGGVLVAQGAAIVGLGRIERGGTRWIDRTAGLGSGARWAGRWAFGFGLSLWLVLPLGLAWALWAPVGSGWGWLLAGAVAAAVASAASLAAAGR